MRDLNFSYKGGIVMEFKFNYRFISVSYESPCESNVEYKEFYNWLSNNCSNDNEEIHKKELIYLFKSYVEIKDLIIEKQNSDEYCIKLLQLTLENRKKLSNYLSETKKDYEFLNDIKNNDKNYYFYTNLLSWYSLTMDTTEKVVKNLHRKSINIKNKKKTSDNLHYIDWTEENSKLEFI